MLFADPPGTILPTGGLDHGHKGYGLALMIEALTQGLGGFGRVEAPTRVGASVFVQVLDPAAFGGAEALPPRRPAGCAAPVPRAPPAPGGRARAAPRRGGAGPPPAALAEGVELYPGMMEGLAARAQRIGVAVPELRTP